jgi:hypothetical protein
LNKPFTFEGVSFTLKTTMSKVAGFLSFKKTIIPTTAATATKTMTNKATPKAAPPLRPFAMQVVPVFVVSYLNE